MERVGIRCFMSNNWKTYVPNVITCIRIVLSLCLLLIVPQTIVFFVFYIICGLTDICDGYLARKWKMSSKRGAMLDSIADLIFIIVLFVIFIPVVNWKIWMLLWIGMIAVIRCLSALIGAVKYHTAAFIHTYGNKVAGFLLFCFPALLKVAGLTITVIVLCTVAIISATEELVIMISSDSLDRDRKWR